MRMAACLLLGVATLTACSGDPSRPTVPIFHGEFGSVLGPVEGGLLITIMNGTLDGVPVGEEGFELVVSGSFRDAWGNVYDPDDLSTGTPISGHAESCLEMDVLVCGADWVIVDIPVAGTG